MLRRGFLGSLLGIAAAPVLLKLPKFETFDEGIILTETPIILPSLLGAGAIQGITVMGLSKSSVASRARLLRGSNIVMDIPLNAAGGLVHWFFAPGNELFFTPEFGFVWDVPDNLQVTTVTRMNDGRHFQTRIANSQRIDLPLEYRDAS